MGIKSLQEALREEMIKQNRRSSLARSYAEADRIREQLRELQTKTVRGIRFDEGWGK